jgi:transcriptional regulator with XRE-family HTH domain
MLGTQLRQLRKERKETLVTVSGAIGRSVSFLSEVERGKTNPSLETLRRLAAYYQVTLDDLSPPQKPVDEMSYIMGRRSAMSYIAMIATKELDGEEATVANLLIERQMAVAQLRLLCVDFGNNDWPDTLHLGDAIEKRLGRYLYDRERAYQDIACDLMVACKLALNAFEKNWAIDWGILERSIARAEKTFACEEK